MKPHIRPATPLDLPGIAPLVAESLSEGVSFIDRLVREYASGINRFDGHGEVLLVAERDGEIVGCCGLNQDPYLADPTVGRVRHLYVLQAHRHTGLGRSLVQAVITVARGGFRMLTLRTDNPVAAELYGSLGFVEAPPIAHATHWRTL